MITLSFAVGPSAQRLVASVQFLLAHRCMDVGDLVQFGDGPAAAAAAPLLEVVRQTVLVTTLRSFHMQEVSVPNARLAEMTVVNARRSTGAALDFVLRVGMHTSDAQIEAIRQAVERFVTERKE